MLHSFMYHEHAMTEGCASPPPATSSVQRNSPYYNIVSLLFSSVEQLGPPFGNS